MKITARICTIAACFLLILAGAASASDVSDVDTKGIRPGREPAVTKIARLIASKMRWKQGVGLDVGRGDASLAVEIAKCTELTIHCVEPDWEKLDKDRQVADAAGLYGTRILVQHGRVDRLAYPDLSANLVICKDRFADGVRERDAKEIYRILSPNGIALVGQSAAAARDGNALTRRQLDEWLEAAGVSSYEIIEEDGVWALITRPRSPGWDEWTHRNHDAANTLASRDEIPYQTYRPQWITNYRPGLASAGVALAGGRVIVAGLSYPDHPATTPYIQVLDAFTGVELWAKVGKKELPTERPPGMYSNREFCSDYAVIGDTLYLLGGRLCHVVDLTDGAIRQSLPIPTEASAAAEDVWLYLSCVGDTLFGGVGESPNVKVDWNTMNYRGRSKAVFALDRESGSPKWVNHAPACTASMTVSEGQVCFCDTQLNLHALDAATGKETWSVQTGLPEGTEIAGGRPAQSRSQRKRAGCLLKAGWSPSIRLRFRNERRWIHVFRRHGLRNAPAQRRIGRRRCGDRSSKVVAA
ncbi:MAG: outer membrane protein assembly factor BamB family protein [Planctomycetota bacterium]|jgi:SAM-dependent methyltransferase